MARLCRLTLLALALLQAPALFSQGCAVCGNTAAAAPVAQQRQLRKGIVVMLLPTMAIIGVFGVLIYRNRR